MRSRTQGVATVTTVANAPYSYDGSPTTHDTLCCSRRIQSQCSASITVLADVPASITSRYGLLNDHILAYSDGIEGSMHSPLCEAHHMINSNTIDPGLDRLTVRLPMATVFPNRLNADGTRNHSVQEALRVPEDLLQFLMGQLGPTNAGRPGFPWQEKHLLLRQMSQLVRKAFDDGLLVLPEVDATDITKMCCCLHFGVSSNTMYGTFHRYGINSNFDAGVYQQRPNLDEEEIIRVLDALQLWLENILYWVFSIVSVLFSNMIVAYHLVIHLTCLYLYYFTISYRL